MATTSLLLTDPASLVAILHKALLFTLQLTFLSQQYLLALLDVAPSKVLCCKDCLSDYPGRLKGESAVRIHSSSRSRKGQTWDRASALRGKQQMLRMCWDASPSKYLVCD